MQTIIASFALLMIGAVAILLWNRTKSGARHMRRQRVALPLLSAGMIALGLLNLFLVMRSPEPVVEGWMSNVTHSYGKSSSSRFVVADNAGTQTLIHARYIGPGFRNGYRVRVKYVAYDHNLEDLTMLDGPFAGWKLHEAEHGGASWGFIVFGVLTGVVSWASVGRSRPRSGHEGRSAG